MNAGWIIVGLMVAVLWFPVLDSWRLRNWRAVTIATSVTLAILVAGLLPYPVGGVLQVVLWVVCGWLFTVHPERASVISTNEYDYVSSQGQILDRMTNREFRPGTTESGPWLAAYEADLRALRALEPPPTWSTLHSETVLELDRRLKLMQRGIRSTPEQLQEGNERWRLIRQQFNDVFKERAGFWIGFPPLRLRSER